MDKTATLYQDIARRTQGDIYLGCVGPVRTGKSTFIKKFMETMVLPKMENQSRKDRAMDELPQSGSGKTIMTTEPKFIPEEAVKLTIDGNVNFNVRLIDCVGYIVPSALGYIENQQPRMVMTPWYDREIPFNMAAEIGTNKVITEHSTIGLVVTTDGSISDIPRSEYQEAEERVIAELKEINKPFVVLLNCTSPKSKESCELKAELEENYGVPVIAVNCLELDQDDITNILTQVLYEFPLKEVAFHVPSWIMNLDKDHWLKSSIYERIRGVAPELTKLTNVSDYMPSLKEDGYINDAWVGDIDLGSGSVRCRLDIPPYLFYQILGEATGLEITDEESLLPCMIELAEMKASYMKIKGALEEVQATGYGIVMPSMNELSLEEPEIIKQGGRYGIKLRASAPSIHIERYKQMCKSNRKYYADKIG